MKKFADKTLISCIHEKLEKHFNGLFQIGLNTHQISISDSRKMKTIMEQKMVNLSYIFNKKLVAELPVSDKSSIKNVNKNLYVSEKMVKNQNHKKYQNLSFMDELLLRLKENDKPLKIFPFKKILDWSSDNDDYQKIFLIDESFEEKLMNFFEKIHEVKSLTDLHDFENQYYDFVHDFIKNSNQLHHQILLENKNFNHQDNSDKNIIHQMFYGKENKIQNVDLLLEDYSIMKNSFHEFCGFLTNLNNIENMTWYFGSPARLNYHEITSEVNVDFDVIKDLEKSNQHLKDIFHQHDLNLINVKLLFDFLNKKYTKEVCESICHYSNKGKTKEYFDIISYAKNVKLIYEHKLSDYKDYYQFYQKHKDDLLIIGVSRLSIKDYDEIYQMDKVNDGLDFLKQCSQHLKEVYQHHQEHNFYPLRLSDEELIVFDKIKKELLNEFPELQLPLDNQFCENIEEQEVGMILHKKLPFVSKNMVTKKAFVEKRDDGLSNEDRDAAYFDDLLNMRNLEKTKVFQSSCDFYFPYLNKDKNLEADSVALALREYNQMAFHFSYTRLYHKHQPVFEFYVKNNGIKQYQLSTELDIDNPSCLSIATSCSNHQGFSQLAYDAMVDFAYQNNLIVCRNLSELSTQGSVRLLNKLNKAQIKFSDALLIDYYEDFEVHVFLNESRFDLVKKLNIETNIETNNKWLKIKKMNEYLFKESDEYIENKKDFIKLNFNEVFVHHFIDKLPQLYGLSWDDKILLNKEQYQDIKKVYDECLAEYIKTHLHLHEEVITLISHVNEVMTYDDDEEEWQIPDNVLDELSDLDGKHDFLFEHYPFDKIDEFQTFYFANVIEKSKSSIEYDIAEKLESLKEKTINQKNKKIMDVKNKLEK